MTPVAKSIYDTTAVGAIGSLTYAGDSANEAARDQFAAEVDQFHAMERLGLIEIVKRNYDGQSVSRSVDAVVFKRLK